MAVRSYAFVWPLCANASVAIGATGAERPVLAPTPYVGSSIESGTGRHTVNATLATRAATTPIEGHPTATTRSAAPGACRPVQSLRVRGPSDGRQGCELSRQVTRLGNRRWTDGGGRRGDGGQEPVGGSRRGRC